MIGLAPDERLAGSDLAQLPASLRAPEAAPDRARRPVLVGTGAALTGLTLVLGVTLVVLAGADVLVRGVSLATAGVLALGAILVGTHWGWVHVAQASADALERRRQQPHQARRAAWLGGIEPYTRWSIVTETAPDGAITILTLRHRPVPCGERSFTFLREVVERELHPDEQPAAAVAERAELLRRSAAAETAAERARYQAAREALQRSQLRREDEQRRLGAARAGSEALSEQINSHLRQPPLEE